MLYCEQMNPTTTRTTAGAESSRDPRSPSVDLDQFSLGVANHFADLCPTINAQFRAPTGVSEKSDHSTVTDTDSMVGRSVTPIIQRYVPGVFVVDEETVESYQDQYERILDHEFVAAVDGIDGTQNFSLGIPDFACSVGLLQKTPDGHKCVAGVVLFPAQRELYYTQGDRVVMRDLVTGEEHTLLPKLEEMSRRSVITVPDNYLDRIVRPDGGFKHAPRILGSVVVDIIYIAKGAIAGSLTDYALWDYAGALAIAQKLGVNFFDPHTGEKKDTFGVGDFERGSFKRQWCLKDTFIVSNEANLPQLVSKFRL